MFSFEPHQKKKTIRLCVINLLHIFDQKNLLHISVVESIYLLKAWGRVPSQTSGSSLTPWCQRHRRLLKKIWGWAGAVKEPQDCHGCWALPSPQFQGQPHTNIPLSMCSHLWRTFCLPLPQQLLHSAYLDDASMTPLASLLCQPFKMKRKQLLTAQQKHPHHNILSYVWIRSNSLSFQNVYKWRTYRITEAEEFCFVKLTPALYFANTLELVK